MNLIKEKFSRSPCKFATLVNYEYGEGDTIHDALANAVGNDIADYINNEALANGGHVSNWIFNKMFDCETAVIFNGELDKIAELFKK